MASTSVSSGRCVYEFTFVEEQQPDGRPGRKVSMTDFSFQPLSYSDLSQANLKTDLMISLEIKNGQFVNHDGLVERIYGDAHISKLKSSFSSEAIGLMKGGWLPSSLAAYRPDTVIFPDRNVMTQIVSRFTNGKVDNGPDFLDLFAEAPIHINPMLCVLEGNATSIPDAAQIKNQLAEAVRKLKKALPKAILMVGPESLNDYVKAIQDSHYEMRCRENFLFEMAPDVKAPVARKNVASIWDKALTTADNCQVPRKSLIVLAVLSVIAVPNGHTPAKRMLKLNDKYSKKDVYNALADLQGLDFLMRFFASSPDASAQFCTNDLPLSLFWVGAQAGKFACDANGLTYSTLPTHELLPGNALEKWLSI